MKQACREAGLPYVFKASFDKANRSSIYSFRGVGLEKGLEILQQVREQLEVPVLTDIHLPEQAEPVAEVVDMLQIPAFLCRQTDLLVAAAGTGLPINIKKGQFMAPEEMQRAAQKCTTMGNERVVLCERGTLFGYNDLVVDIRSIVRMAQIGFPVLFDVTHSTQQPGARGDKSGGQPSMAPALAAAGVAAGAHGVFVETHPDPPSALSDSATMLPVDDVPALLKRLKTISEAAGSGE
jgi:2-dehydro-3-deoxyphosphooctonate aldolase (KDO 8-P synthase)